MQLSFEAAAVGDNKEFWASMTNAALQGQAWRVDYDPWDGFVKEIDDEGATIVLKNMVRRDLELQMYMGRSFLRKEAWEQLAVGVPFIIEFKFEDDKPYIELRFF